MEAILDSQPDNSYSIDQIIKSAFEMELHSRALKRLGADRELVESYLKDRINEINKKWSE